MGWVTDHAPRDSELDSCVTCGLCLPHCPTFRVTGSEAASPRGRLAAMAAVASGIADVDERFEEVMGLCLQCRACEPVCPSVVPFGRAMEGARIEIAAQRPSPSRTARDRALGRLVGSRTAIRGATAVAALAQKVGAEGLPFRAAGRLSGLRPLPLTGKSRVGATYPGRGAVAGRVALLAGCVQEPWFGGVNTAAIELLVRAGYDVDLPAAQTCCGALAAHDGAAEAAERLAETNVGAFAGYDLVVATAAGCSAHLAGYGEWSEGGEELAARARDITVVVAESIASGRLPALPANGTQVSIQDPCHLRHAQRVIDEPRAIVRAAGYEPVEIDEYGFCCGAAGFYVMAQPEMSDELGRRKADQVRAAGLRTVVSANPGCEMQLRSNLDSDFEVLHPVELYAQALAAAEARL